MSIYREMGFTDVDEHPQGAVLYALARTFTLLQKRFAPCYATHQLDAVKVNALMIIKHIGRTHGIPQREIADRLILSASNVTHLIDGLERQGFITRHAAKDRRVKLLKITPKGTKLLDTLWPTHRTLAEQVVTLSSTERKTLLQLLTKLRAAAA